MTQFWWMIFPYVALAVMIVGTIFRFVYGQRGWGSKSSEILEKRWLRAGSLLFHWGMLFVIGGHVMGLLIPLRVYDALGVSTEAYHLMADVVGGLAGIAATAGCALLLLRRVFNKRVRRNSTPSDYVALGLLFVVIALGAAQTLIYNNIVGPYEYRLTVGPWTRGLILLHPNAGLMVNVPLMLQIHILFTFALFAVSPFTRLVHVWSAPVRYPSRAPIQYRSRWAASAVSRRQSVVSAETTAPITPGTPGSSGTTVAARKLDASGTSGSADTAAAIHKRDEVAAGRER